MGWHTNSMPLPKEVDPNECKLFIRNLNGTDSSELKYSSTNFERLSFQTRIEKKTNAIHCNKS